MTRLQMAQYIIGVVLDRPSDEVHTVLIPEDVPFCADIQLKDGETVRVYGLMAYRLLKRD